MPTDQHRGIESMISSSVPEQVDHRVDENGVSVKALAEAGRNDSALCKSWAAIAYLAKNFGREAGGDNES